jgi:serine/threonine protein kinase
MRKADVWALGCVLFELFSGGQRLFTWQTEQQKFMQLASLYSADWAPPQLPANVAGWQEVVDAMLTVDPALRPLPSDVLRMGNFGCAFCISRTTVWLPCALATAQLTLTLCLLSVKNQGISAANAWAAMGSVWCVQLAG